MADTLVAELRARGHEAETVSIPFKWYPGARVLDQAFLWRLVDLTEADGRPIDRVIATKFPAYCVRHPNKVAWVLHQFRQAYDYDRTELGQFSEAPTDRATIRALERLDRVALGEARKVFATSRNVADRLMLSAGIEAELLPHPPQKLAFRTAEPEHFVLSVNRLDRAKRIDLLIEAAKSDPDLRIVIAGEGPDRERLEQLASGLNGQVEFTGRVDDERLADLVRPLPRRLLRAGRRRLRHGPVRGVPVAEARRDDARRGRTARGRARPRDRSRRRARPGGARAGLCVPGRARRRGEGVGPRRQGGSRTRHLGRVHRRIACMKVAYYSPMPPSRSGIADYSALLLPALRERIDVVVAEPGRRDPAADIALYHVGNDPDAHGWIVDALRRRPGVVVLHEFVLHHLISGITLGRGNPRGYFDAMERDLGVTGRLLALGVADNLLPLLWETQPERFPLAGVVLDLADGLIVHSHYVESRAREAGYDGQIWRVPHPAWPDVAVAPVEITGDPLIGCFGYLNVNKRVPQLLEAFALASSQPAGCTPAARRRQPASGSISNGGSSGSASPMRRSCARTTCPRSGCGRSWLHATCWSTSARRRWARRPAR